MYPSAARVWGWGWLCESAVESGAAHVILPPAPMLLCPSPHRPRRPAAALSTAPCPLQVVKASSGKFHPLHQWFYFDSIESLPDGAWPLAPEEVAPQVCGDAGGAEVRGPAPHLLTWL